jgi:predicted MFS family arabinose efflux permease
VRVTEWQESLVVAVSSVAALVGGAGALAAGRVLDRWGSRRVFLLGLVGAGALAAASQAETFGAFAPAAVVGGGLLAATGHYHTTLGTAAGLHPERPARAISIVTLYGAFSSTIMLPLGGVLADRAGWRTALLTYAALAASGYVWAAIAASVRHAETRESAPLAWSPLVVVAIVASVLGAAGFGTIGVYQVPIMVSLGLALPLASTLAGLRGVAQFLGRLPIDPLVSRLGSRRALVWANALIAVGAVLLVWSNRPAVALAFALIAGVGIGAFSPLSGIFAFEVAGPSRVGTLMGIQAAAAGVGIAAGPYLAANAVEASGDRRMAIPVAVVMLLGAAAALATGRRWDRTA